MRGAPLCASRDYDLMKRTRFPFPPPPDRPRGATLMPNPPNTRPNHGPTVLALAVCLIAQGAAAATGAVPETGSQPTRRAIEDAANRGLRLVEKAVANYPTHRTCFSCHHQTLPLQAMVSAREYGLEIDAGVLAAGRECRRESFR